MAILGQVLKAGKTAVSSGALGPLSAIGAKYTKDLGVTEKLGLNSNSLYKDPAIKANTPQDSSSVSDSDQAAYDKQLESEMGMDTWSQRTQKAPTAPKSINTVLTDKNSQASQDAKDAKKAENIGKGWENSTDELKATQKSLDSTKNVIGNLSKVRDQYLTSIDSYKTKTDAAIAGNKTLIESNQKKALDNLAGDTRRSIDNTNVMLGVASDGSAGRVMARAIANNAGKQRASTLTTYGDQNSQQNQAAQNANEEYTLKRAEAYEWEKTQREQATQEYKAKEDAIKRLKSKASGWKDDDIKALSDKNFTNFINGLNSIQAWGQNYRTELAAKMEAYGGNAQALDQAAVGVDAPAEINTPKFSENIDINDPTSDWYDPTNTDTTKKTGKIFKGYDALGNPIYEDEVVDANATA